MPKHEPTPSYFHLVRHLAKCMMISDQLNRHNHGSYTVRTVPSSNINITDEDESKEIIMHKTLSENKYKDVSESECNIDHKTLSQKNSADVPDNAIKELKDEQVILTYSSVVEIYSINLTLRINNRSWKHQHRMNTIRR